MSISCALAKDLLSLYLEEMLSEESKAAVNEHLKGCAACRAALEGMRALDGTKLALGAPLRSIGNVLRRDRWRRVAMAAFALLFLFTIAFYHTTKRQYVPYAPGLVQVEKAGEGRVKIEARGIQGIWFEADTPTQADVATRRSDGTTVFLSFFRSAGMRPEDDAISTYYITFEEVGVFRVYYAFPGETAVLVFGPQTDDGVMVLPRLALNYYWRVAAVAAGGLLVLLLIFYKREKARRVLVSLLCVPVCYVLSHFAIKLADGTSWDMLYDLQFIIAGWVFASAAAWLWLRQRRLTL